MSVDTPTETVDRRPGFSCGICGETAADDGQFLVTYAGEDALDLEPTEADGLLALCGHCSGEVTELTVAWSDLERPPVGTGASIADDYAAVAGACSFCDAVVDDGPVLGVESWAAPAGDAPACDEHDNYALCESCVAIFEEFLQGIATE